MKDTSTSALIHIDELGFRMAKCYSACEGIEDPVAAIQAAREALETVLRLPVARMYPDGPCLDRYDHEECKAALNLLAPKPTTP